MPCATLNVHPVGTLKLKLSLFAGSTSSAHDELQAGCGTAGGIMPPVQCTLPKLQSVDRSWPLKSMSDELGCWEADCMLCLHAVPLALGVNVCRTSARITRHALLGTVTY
jgi:hypothetical protein